MAKQQFTAEELANEIWRPVIGYEGIYAISNLGRVKRSDTNVLRRPTPNKRGYIPVLLFVNNKYKGFRVHRLVAAAFIGPCPPGHSVNHKDADKTNNRLNNLEYVTFSGNIQHALANNLMPRGDRHGSHLHPERWTRGESHYCAKLTADQVREIRRCYAAGGITQKEIGMRYGVTKSTIRHIVFRHSWKHV